MDWFVLQPVSVAALAEFVLSLVMTLYIFSIRQKSKDTWRFLLFVVASTIYYFIAFLFFSDINFNQLTPLFWIHHFSLGFFQVTIYPFVYNFKGNPFPKEEKITIVTAVILVTITTTASSAGFPLHFFLYLLIVGWFVVVLIRKAFLVQKTADINLQMKQLLLR